MISGIQHFSFCPRQWALIHIEQQWNDNVRTVDGQVFHHRAHDGDPLEKRGNVLITRGLQVHSNKLGIHGICDIVEFHLTDQGFPLKRYEGLWKAYPVEYKKGNSKESDADRVQLCAQALCLEEMLSCRIDEGSLFYGEPRRREKISFSDALRERTVSIINQMHWFFDKGITPKANKTKSCKACSLIGICLPELSGTQPVNMYIKENIEESS